MKLYFSPGACSLAPHIILCEMGLDHTLEKVNLQSKQTASGKDFYTINPKGSVPALVCDDGSLLTEVSVILQYLADLDPEKSLIPAVGTMARYRLMETLNFIATELHKTMGALFNPQLSGPVGSVFTDMLTRRLSTIAKQLGDQPYLGGEHVSIADAYLFVVLSWAKLVHVSLETWPQLIAFSERVAARKGVHAARLAEGLVKA